MTVRPWFQIPGVTGTEVGAGVPSMVDTFPAFDVVARGAVSRVNKRMICEKYFFLFKDWVGKKVTIQNVQ